MSNIKVLDCTLRDGGYINDWRFGYNNIRSMLKRLTKAKVDVIECGFLEDQIYDKERSFFNDVDQIERVLPEERGITEYVAMTRYGLLDIRNLKEYDGRSINGIRVTFHENEAEEAIEFCRQVKEKGYKVYVQPVGTTSYTDSYLLKLIEIVNDLDPYAFYIVDTLGLMRKDDLLRMFYLVNNNLNDDIIIGFHSHNNLQLSFSNAQVLTDLQTTRTITIDSSVDGMGRGAGNLNTELIIQHLNSMKGSTYHTDYILEIVDETIQELAQKYTWGYSVPYYLAAINNCHPNYASYLMNRKSLPVKSISSILALIPHDKRELYDKDYIAKLYMDFQKHNIDDSKDIEELSDLMNGKKVMLIAPGRSIKEHEDTIKEYKSDPNVLSISVNFDGENIKPQYVFFSNDKRYQKFISNTHGETDLKIILTSNIHEESNFTFKVNYGDYLNSQPLVNDNATLMMLSLLIKIGIEEVFIAGFDGFDIDTSDNYAEDQLEIELDQNLLAQMNAEIAEIVKEYSKQIQLQFITPSLYQQCGL